MVFTGVGGVDHEQLSSLAEKYFGDLTNEYKRKVPQKTGVRFTGSEFLYRDDNYPYMFGAIAVENVPRDDFDCLAMKVNINFPPKKANRAGISLKVASQYVGSWDRTHATSLNAPSSLVQKLTINPELQAFESFSNNYDSTGLWGFYFVAKGDHDHYTTELCTTIQREWKHLSYGLTEEEIDRAKNAFKTNHFRYLDSNTNLAEHFAIEVHETFIVLIHDKFFRC